jgi:uncharacterized protein (TIGR02996 family)
VTTTDPTLRRLLNAVLADPADDTARLVLADALEEAGDWERAEFIRDQTEWRPGSADIDLLDANLEAWCPWFERHPELGLFRTRHHHYGLKVTHAGGQVTMWSKGFVAEVRCTLADYEAHAAALFAAQPIERVVLTDKQPSSFDKGVPPFYWFGDGWISSRHDDELPDYLLGIMEELRLGNSFNRPDGAKARTFDASQLALDAASAALVTYGRRLARIDVPCDDCDGSGRTTLGKPLKAGGFDHKCLACGGSGCVLNADH